MMVHRKGSNAIALLKAKSGKGLRQLTRLYRDPEALYGALRAIDTYIPGMCLLTALVQHPEVALLGLAPSHLTRWVAELRVALPEVDLPPLLARSS